jgi:16S rRNA (uracil1498-N3)-methyltransferase
VGQKVTLQDAEFHHATRVMRHKKGDHIELINGVGSLATGVISSIHDQMAEVTVASEHQEEKPPFSLSLALAISKPNHLEFAVEKIVELGVDDIWIFPAERSERKELSATQQNRLTNIIIAATKQCGRLFLPNLHLVASFDKVDIQNRVALFGSLKIPLEEPPLQQRSITLFIGPESGFSEKERNQLQALGIKPFCFHPNTLRAETAAIAGCALLYDRLLWSK